MWRLRVTCVLQLQWNFREPLTFQPLIILLRAPQGHPLVFHPLISHQSVPSFAGLINSCIDRCRCLFFHTSLQTPLDASPIFFSLSFLSLPLCWWLLPLYITPPYTLDNRSSSLRRRWVSLRIHACYSKLFWLIPVRESTYAPSTFFFNPDSYLFHHNWNYTERFTFLFL